MGSKSLVFHAKIRNRKWAFGALRCRGMYLDQNNLAVGEGWVCHVWFNEFVVEWAAWARGFRELWTDS